MIYGGVGECILSDRCLVVLQWIRYPPEIRIWLFLSPHSSDMPNVIILVDVGRRLDEPLLCTGTPLYGRSQLIIQTILKTIALICLKSKQKQAQVQIQKLRHQKYTLLHHRLRHHPWIIHTIKSSSVIIGQSTVLGFRPQQGAVATVGIPILILKFLLFHRCHHLRSRWWISP